MTKTNRCDIHHVTVAEVEVLTGGNGTVDSSMFRFISPRGSRPVLSDGFLFPSPHLERA